MRSETVCLSGPFGQTISIFMPSLRAAATSGVVAICMICALTYWPCKARTRSDFCFGAPSAALAESRLAAAALASALASSFLPDFGSSARCPASSSGVGYSSSAIGDTVQPSILPQAFASTGICFELRPSTRKPHFAETDHGSSGSSKPSTEHNASRTAVSASASDMLCVRV